LQRPASAVAWADSVAGPAVAGPGQRPRAAAQRMEAVLAGKSRWKPNGWKLTKLIDHRQLCRPTAMHSGQPWEPERSSQERIG